MASEDHRQQDAAPPPRPRNIARIGFVAAAVAIVVAAIGILQRRSHEAEVKQWTQEQAIPTVAVISPRAGAAAQRLVLPGTIQAWYEAPIFARVPGYLKEWYFDYGAHVKKGDILADIETPDLDAQLAAAQAKLNSARAQVKVREAEKQFAETTYQRWRDSPKGVVSVQEQESKQADFNSAVARLNSATAEVAVDQGDVDRLQALAGFKNITAPFDGVVTARETDVGALINAGSGTGGGNGPRALPRRRHPRDAGFRSGAAAIVGRHSRRTDRRSSSAAISRQTFKAAVATTSSAINTSARTLLVELHADNPDGQLQPGAYAQIDFDLAEQPQRRAHPDQRADVPRARHGSRA